METFLKNNLWNIISLIITLFSIGIAFYFFRKSQRIRRVNYFINSINLIVKSTSILPELKVSYKNKSIENLTLTKFALWNDGSETIDKDGIAPKNNLKIISKDGIYILNYEMIFEKNKANNFKFELNNEQNVLFINFDYFDKNEGIILKIYHTGNNYDDINLDGAIKGGKLVNIKNLLLTDFANAEPLNLKRKIKFHVIINIPIISLFLIIIILGQKEKLIDGVLIITIFTIFWNLVGFYVRRRKVPSGFEKILN